MFKKTLVAALFATTAMSGVANAALNVNTVAANAAGGLFVAAYNAGSGQTFVMGLDSIFPNLNASGAAADPFISGGTSINLAADSNWTAFTGNAKYTAATTTYQVLGADQGWGSLFVTNNTLITAANTPSVAQFQTAVPSAGNTSFLTWEANTTATGTTSALMTSAGNPFNGLNNNVANTMGSLSTTAALGGNLNFYQLQNFGTYIAAVAEGANGTPGVWNLSTTGNLSFAAAAAAPVPEADSWAMMLAGLGLMGFMARRRIGA